jgi:hypothetical protein
VDGTRTSGVDSPPAAPTAGSAEQPSRSRWLIPLVVVAAVLAVMALMWAVGVEPLHAGSGGYDVRGENIELLSVHGIASNDLFIAPYTEGERVTLRFPLVNDSRVPVRLVEIVPLEHVVTCGWQPVEVLVSPSILEDFAPFQPTTLWPGEILDFSITGTFSCEPVPARIEGLTFYDSVPIRYRVAGLIPRMSRVDPGYTFGWSTNPPETFTAELVDVVRPSSELD